MSRGGSNPTILAAVKNAIPILALCLVVAACSGESDAVTSTVGTAATSTTTTMDIRVCEDLADDAVRWVESLVAELEGISYEVLVDRTLWPESLVRVDEEGGALQAESDAAGCDESLIRGAVVQAAEQMTADGAASQLLLDLLAPGAPPTRARRRVGPLRPDRAARRRLWNPG